MIRNLSSYGMIPSLRRSLLVGKIPKQIDGAITKTKPSFISRAKSRSGALNPSYRKCFSRRSRSDWTTGLGWSCLSNKPQWGKRWGLASERWTHWTPRTEGLHRAKAAKEAAHSAWASGLKPRCQLPADTLKSEGARGSGSAADG